MLEESQQGWIVAHACASHSDHATEPPRALSDAERRATYTAHNSKIPDELIDLVTPDMLLFRPTVSRLKSFIDEKAHALGYEVVWTYNDVFNVFAAKSGHEREHDSSNLVDALQKRLEEKGLQYEIRLDDQGRLIEVFFEIVRAPPPRCVTAARALAARTMHDARSARA